MIQVVRNVDVTATLLSIEVGMQVLCPNSLIRCEVVRSIASRLKKSRKGRFVVSNCRGGVTVRRCAL